MEAKQAYQQLLEERERWGGSSSAAGGSGWGGFGGTAGSSAGRGYRPSGQGRPRPLQQEEEEFYGLGEQGGCAGHVG